MSLKWHYIEELRDITKLSKPSEQKEERDFLHGDTKNGIKSHLRQSEAPPEPKILKYIESELAPGIETKQLLL